MGKPKDAALTHEEIWDDSALVQSWDEAVEEYQLYHSIHAKGENVEDVLKEAEASGLANEADPLEDTEDVAAEDVPMEAESENVVEPDESTTTTQTTQNIAGEPQASTAESTTASVPDPTLGPGPGTMPMPGPVLSNSKEMCKSSHEDILTVLLVQDENLKRLMMSWYFAGYYTGLYEGQQQAQSKS
ncbi:hypothetical protein N7492_002911 [Penicillium capsulatum]|uniref:Survival Motor Neuron Gemin2-binding domain-containing protein n=1 Tax=Penicillium capsulatum TaxID=69766 RepID=A0A9W9IQ16_9EURO|nr:hypothetical protein N7492_002911 [Penicillium capsulatum]KAJ6122495.1 hypothetical protein N7512_004960 [Penicillium capsulatum]